MINDLPAVMFTDSSDPGDLGDVSPGVSTSHRCFVATRPVMKDFRRIWQSRNYSGAVEKEDFPDGIYTGFLSDDKAGRQDLKFMDAFCRKGYSILTDPVMGDDGAVYPIYTEELRSRFCEPDTPFLCDHNTEPTEALLLRKRKNGV